LNTPALPPRCVMKSCVRAIQASTGPTTVSGSLLRTTPGTVNIHSRHVMCLDLRDSLRLSPTMRRFSSSRSTGYCASW